MMSRRLRAAVVLIVLAGALAAPVWAQRNRWGWGGWGFGQARPYDGTFTLARLYYEDYGGWAFDWPDMEYNLGQIVDAITAIRPKLEEGGNVFRMDDPELLKFPIAYLSEPGYWYPSEAEAAGLRAFIRKGGFLIVDDFRDDEWFVFERAMGRVLPGGKIDRLDVSHPVFSSFFRITSLEIPYPGTTNLIGEFYGIHEDNDPSKRLAVVINYNMDIGDYMEWSATGRYVVSPTNEAYKFAINYLIYGLTH